MSLTDLMSHAGLAGFAEIGMVLFFLAFLGIVWWVFRPANRKRWTLDARMPLDDVHPQQPRKAED
ncbi:MAG: cbb3-type cytochrome c oxidase subunit 3 [bacterium]